MHMTLKLGCGALPVRQEESIHLLSGHSIQKGTLDTFWHYFLKNEVMRMGNTCSSGKMVQPSIQPIIQRPPQVTFLEIEMSSHPLWRVHSPHLMPWVCVCFFWGGGL